MKELNLSINKSTKHANDVTDFNSMTEDKRQESLFVDGPATYRIAQDLSSLDKSKSLGYSEDKMKSSIGFCLDRSEDTNTSMDTAKDYPVAFGRPVKDEKQLAFSFDEIGDFQREPRSKGVHFSLDRGKELTFPKTYNHPLDGKDFGFALDPRRDVGAFSLDRFRGSAFRDNTVVPDAADYRVTQIPTRNPELEAITMERIRRSHVLTPDLPTRNLSAHLSHSHAIVHMQHSHQQQQQPQCKSFTIDAILGLRNNQRHKQQRSQQHPYRKHQGQEGSAKTNSLGSSSNGGGKLKRVRTIFTAEQLERLEAAFARQQYMVGPERLYLAHELGLSEAQTFKIAYKKSTNDNYESTEVLETISEHTEPSPTASGTMNQTELETQTQMRKTRTGRIVAPRSAATCSSGLPTEGNNVVDPHWKPRPTQSFPHNRECRRSDYDATEPISGCYSASNTYRSKYPSVPSGFSKLPQSASFDQAYRVPQQNLRTTRNKILTGKSFANNNYAVVRKNCYKPDPEDEEEAKYEEEDGTYAQDNAEDEVGDEADEDPDENEEYHDKEYEEQEADDEIDDESDAFQTQLHRAQPTAAKGSTLRNQHPRPRPPDQQREFNKIQCRQRMAQLYQDQKMPRYCPPSYDPERVSGNDTSYGDVITDDERTPPSSPSRRTTPRVSEIRQGISAWQPPRKSLERNHARLIPVSSHQRHQQQEHHHQLNRHNRPQPQQQPSRRPRTMKPEMESLMIPQTTNTNVKKCCVCGRATNPIAVKLDLARRGTSRLNECRGFTVNGPTGEDGETEESVVCGRCANFPAMEEIRASCDGSSRPGSLYAGKMHRSRLQNPKMYETTDDQTMDDMLSVFESAPQRSGGTGYSAPRERPRHSLQPTRSPSRRGRFFER